jgi:hypothetical protein
MSEHVPSRLQALVRRRAGDVCEYYRLPQSSQEATFHIDHIQPLANGGGTTAANLALACVTCSLRKAARSTARDPRSKESVALFHPRYDRWSEHFRWTRSWKLVGLTPVGRATITALGMNRPAIVAIRQTLALLDWPGAPAG